MTYKINLTENDIKAIQFIGHRYNWSDEWPTDQVGETELTEAEAMEWKQAVDSDDSLFPMLNLDSNLAKKLWELYESIM